jgi:hypothetical protein
MNLIGLGKASAQLNFYIENIPPLKEYQSLEICRPMQIGEIKTIAELTGNHWRKIFNVYAKIIFELSSPPYNSWQEFRDNALMQAHSNENLLFNLPAQAILQNLSTKNTFNNNISIIMGKSFATKLGLSQRCHWLSTEFAINTEKIIIDMPLF